MSQPEHGERSGVLWKGAQAPPSQTPQPPASAESTLRTHPGWIGSPLSRPEGPLKVTGRAVYAADTPMPGVLFAVMVPATIANGRIRRIDPPSAERAPGVVAVLSHLDLPKLGKAPSPPLGQVFLPMQSDQVMYEGQPVAIVIAHSLEQAEHAARLVTVTYEAAQPIVFGKGEVKKAGDWFAPPDLAKGDVEAGLAAADVKIEQTYTMPTRHHNPMEPSATIASWNGDHLTLHDATQWSSAVQSTMAALFGIKPEQVRVLCPFTGGGFGSKGYVWPHQFLTAAAARHVGKPVKLVLRRSDMYTSHGYQAGNRQSISLGAKRDGRITAIRHNSVAVSSMFGTYLDLITSASRAVYATPAFETTIRLEHTNLGEPTAMRPPQEGPGMVALESAMDELAYALDLDPLELRLRNYAEVDPESGNPFSSKELRQCYLEAARRFGWEKRPKAVRSMRDGRLLLGWGMATAIMSTFRFPAAARARLRADGQVVIETSAQEIGTGNYAVLAQVAADTLRVDSRRVTVRLGDTVFPEACPTTGSSSTMCVGAAVLDAATKLRGRLTELAGGAAASAEDYVETMRRAGVEEVVADGSWTPAEGVAFDAAGKVSGRTMHGYGAVFVEVAVDPDLGLVRLRRCVGGYSAGRIINPKTARSQMTGAIIWGYGQAVLEESALDPTLGRFVSKNLAGVVVPVNADIPPIDVFFVEEHDPYASPLGARGIGELGAVGVAPAILNAVYHATGKRVRDLPLRIERVLESA
jgi:xanthine dehydrogenase YagR molybdenum-binding subunit